MAVTVPGKPELHLLTGHCGHGWCNKQHCANSMNSLKETQTSEPNHRNPPLVMYFFHPPPNSRNKGCQLSNASKHAAPRNVKQGFGRRSWTLLNEATSSFIRLRDNKLRGKKCSDTCGDSSPVSEWPCTIVLVGSLHTAFRWYTSTSAFHQSQPTCSTVSLA